MEDLIIGQRVSWWAQDVLRSGWITALPDSYGLYHIRADNGPHQEMGEMQYIPRDKLIK